MARSKISGYGLFAKNDIPRNSIACLYSGDIVRYTDSPDSNHWIASLDSEWGIDAHSSLNYSGRWANHSLAHNARIVLSNEGLFYDGRIKRYCVLIYTIRDISRK